jgi:hypothetical protein
MTDLDRPIPLPLQLGYAVGAVFWLVAYGFTLLRCWRDKSYGFPWMAIALNVTWEFIYSFVYVDRAAPLWYQGNRLWILLDLGLLAQLLRYGRPLQRIPEIRRWFHPLVALSLAGSYGFILLFADAFDDWSGGEIAFVTNLIMSLLFIFMYFERRDLRGLSYRAAWAKMVATFLILLVTLPYHSLVTPNPAWVGFLLYCGLVTFALDATYVVLLTRARRGLAPSVAQDAGAAPAGTAGGAQPAGG